MADTKRIGKAYRVCTDATPGAEQYDKLSMWTDYSDVETSNNKTLKDQLTYVEGITSAVTISNVEYSRVILTDNNLIEEGGMLDVYVPESKCKVTPSQITISNHTVTILFPKGNNNMTVRVRCWK